MHIKPLCYTTVLSADACIAAITAQPWEYGDGLMPLWYECAGTAPRELVVTFRGGKYRKTMRTRCRLTFAETAAGTDVTLEFLGELLGLPPMTPPADIDLFMAQKLRAVRI